MSNGRPNYGTRSLRDVSSRGIRRAMDAELHGRARRREGSRRRGKELTAYILRKVARANAYARRMGWGYANTERT